MSFRISLFAQWLCFAGLVGCGGPMAMSTATQEISSAKLTASPANQATSAADSRQIIYNADIAIETSDLEAFSSELTREVEQLGGFVSNFSERRISGDRRSGSWTLRIDATKFFSLLDWLDQAASVTHKQVTSQDVTEEYVDLTARVENKRNTEKRLAAILAERPGELDEILLVEKEIDRVREDIERIEGRLRFLSERVTLSTITLTANTRVQYLAPQQATFVSQISETWRGSLDSLLHLFKRLLLGMVAALPWLLVMFYAAGSIAPVRSPVQLANPQ